MIKSMKIVKLKRLYIVQTKHHYLDVICQIILNSGEVHYRRFDGMLNPESKFKKCMIYFMKESAILLTQGASNDDEFLGCDKSKIPTISSDIFYAALNPDSYLGKQPD